jgi:flagellar hook-associated protein 1 FlgK
MSLQGILSAATSGLATAETQLQIVSNNVTNVDTKGYVTEVADQGATTTAGATSGVGIEQIHLATNAFLDQSARQANAASGSADVQSQYYSQVQALFGDPSATTSFTNTLATALSSFGVVAENPTSSTYIQQAVNNVQQVFTQASGIASGIQQVRGAADSQIGSDVTTVNGLLQQINTLNAQISRTSVAGQDASGLENTQQSLVSQLSSYMNVTVTPNTNSGVTVRTNDGQLLVGTGGAASLSYTPTATADGQTVFSPVTLTSPGGVSTNLENHISTGSLAGLLQLRDVLAPQAATQLGELTSQFANQLNKASNAYTAAPPPSTLTGSTQGLDLPSAISGFSGSTTLAITNSSGVLQHQVAIDFTAGTVTLDGGAATSFSPSTFLSTLNGVLGSNGSASFTNNKLSLSATGGNGIAVVDSSTTPSDNGGSGFSAYFGLNNLVSSSQLTNYNTGLTTASASLFGAGGQIGLQLSSGPGAASHSFNVTIPAGGTMANVLAALNDPTTGVGAYGSFALDANGRLTFASSASPAPTLSVTSDSTSWNGGASLSQIFGVGQGLQSDLAQSFAVNPTILKTPTSLPLAAVNLNAAAGVAAVLPGDGSGAQALADAGQVSTTFAAAGGVAAGASTVTTYASNLLGAIGEQASNLTTQQTTADALQSQVASSQSSSEGVNLDQQLTALTTYQQSYSASARLVQAVVDMYAALNAMVANG